MKTYLPNRRVSCRGAFTLIELLGHPIPLQI